MPRLHLHALVERQVSYRGNGTAARGAGVQQRPLRARTRSTQQHRNGPRCSRGGQQARSRGGDQRVALPLLGVREEATSGRPNLCGAGGRVRAEARERAGGSMRVRCWMTARRVLRRPSTGGTEHGAAARDRRDQAALGAGASVPRLTGTRGAAAPPPPGGTFRPPPPPPMASPRAAWCGLSAGCAASCLARRAVHGGRAGGLRGREGARWRARGRCWGVLRCGGQTPRASAFLGPSPPPLAAPARPTSRSTRPGVPLCTPPAAPAGSGPMDGLPRRIIKVGVEAAQRRQAAPGRPPQAGQRLARRPCAAGDAAAAQRARGRHQRGAQRGQLGECAQRGARQADGAGLGAGGALCAPTPARRATTRPSPCWMPCDAHSCAASLRPPNDCSHAPPVPQRYFNVIILGPDSSPYQGARPAQSKPPAAWRCDTAWRR